MAAAKTATREVNETMLNAYIRREMEQGCLVCLDAMRVKYRYQSIRRRVTTGMIEQREDW